MGKSNVRYLATKSRRVHERMMIDHYAREFRNQRKVKVIRFLTVSTAVCGLAGLAVLLPLALSRFLTIVFG